LHLFSKAGSSPFLKADRALGIVRDLFVQVLVSNTGDRSI